MAKAHQNAQAPKADAQENQSHGNAPQEKIGSEEPRAENEVAEKSGAAVMISSAVPRRRAGLAFGPVAQKVYKSDLSEAQWAAVDGDPLIKLSLATDDDTE